MKLSDAIRLGAMTHPQAFGYFESNGATCALGAAGSAIAHHFTDMYQVLCVWPFLASYGSCPMNDCHWRSELGDVIAHLNDAHHWTREQIADFVATVEPQEVTWTVFNLCTCTVITGGALAPSATCPVHVMVRA